MTNLFRCVGAPSKMSGSHVVICVAFLPVTGIRSCLRVLLGIFTSQPGFQHLWRRCLRWKPGTGPFLAGLGKPLPLAQITSLITGWAGRDLRTDSRWERNFAPSRNLAIISTSPSSNLSIFDIKCIELRVHLDDQCLFGLWSWKPGWLVKIPTRTRMQLRIPVTEQLLTEPPGNRGSRCRNETLGQVDIPSGEESPWAQPLVLVCWFAHSFTSFGLRPQEVNSCAHLEITQ
jgi:hypothetical protein